MLLKKFFFQKQEKKDKKMPSWRGIELESPCCLDLFCGGGGAAHGLLAYPAGLLKNGFKTVVGVDIEDHKQSYEHAKGLHFVKEDVLSLTEKDLENFDFVWASPPCQAFCGLVTKKQREMFQDRWNEKGKHLNLIPQTRSLLEKSKKPYIIENVPTSPLKNSIRLCGTQFEGLKVFRHRHFESNVPLSPPSRKCNHSNCSIGGLMSHISLPKTEKMIGELDKIPDGIQVVEMHHPCRNNERVDYSYKATTDELKELFRKHYGRSYLRSMKEICRVFNILVPLNEEEKKKEQERYDKTKKSHLPEGSTQFFPVYGALSTGRGTTHEWQDALKAPFLTRKECAQAIPPQYSEFLGEQILSVLKK